MYTDLDVSSTVSAIVAGEEKNWKEMKESRILGITKTILADFFIGFIF